MKYHIRIFTRWLLVPMAQGQERSPRRLTSPAGLQVAICPAQVMDTNCDRCRLCARPERKVVVGFLAHGNRKVRLDGRLRAMVEDV